MLRHSLPVGSPWDFKTKINPLIHTPNPTLLKGLTQLERAKSGSWNPSKIPIIPIYGALESNLESSHQALRFKMNCLDLFLELCGRIQLEHAFTLMNQTPYGLTAGIHSLDDGNKEAWLKRSKQGIAISTARSRERSLSASPLAAAKIAVLAKEQKPEALIIWSNSCKQSK